MSYSRSAPTSRFSTVSFCVLVTLGVLAAQGTILAYVPWDTLVNDNWVETVAGQTPVVNLYTVNGGYNDSSYPVFFLDKNGRGGGSGMNALKFEYQTVQTGHLASSNLSDSFEILNTGNNNTFDHLILGIAVQTPSLPADFGLSLIVSGGNSWSTTGSNDFVYYDAAGNDTGRPSGYYSGTSPASEPLAYDFSAGMVCLIHTGVTLNPDGGSATVSYNFTNLPSRAVFSLYGFISTDTPASVYHTNRALPDNIDSKGASVSTFEVVPEPAGLLLMITAAGLLPLRRSSNTIRSVQRESHGLQRTHRPI